MLVQEVKKQSLIAQVTDQLRGEIAAGRWGVGDRIPTEPQLCEMTGTARNTVREAVQALVHAGLLERRQGSGTYVIASDEYEALLGGYFSAAAQRDLLELRTALDVTAAELAAQRRTDHDIVELRALLVRRNELWRTAPTSAADRQEAIVVDAAVHRGIVAASHNSIYLSVYDSLLPALKQSIAQRTVVPGNSFEASHTELVEAVAAGDPDRARAAARAIIDCVAAT